VHASSRQMVCKQQRRDATRALGVFRGALATRHAHNHEAAASNIQHASVVTAQNKTPTAFMCTTSQVKGNFRTALVQRDRIQLCQTLSGGKITAAVGSHHTCRALHTARYACAAIAEYSDQGCHDCVTEHIKTTATAQCPGIKIQ
jgi:hypothetical protein